MVDLWLGGLVADKLESDMVMYPWIWYREICINDTYVVM
jgi:hypothetical protein